MELNEALNILGLEKVSDEQSLKKHFRKKMRENHPDSGGSHDTATKLNTAYTVIVEALKNSKGSLEAKREFDDYINREAKEKVKSINISMHALDKLFEGNELKDKNGNTVLSIENLPKSRVLVNCDIDIEISQGDRVIVFNHPGISMYNHNVEYNETNLTYKFNVNDGLDGEVGIKVSLNGKNVTAKVNRKSLKIKFNYEWYSVLILIERS